MITILPELEKSFEKCSDCLLHPQYQLLLNQLLDYPLTEDLVAFLCEKATSKKHFCEIRFEHLRILLLNSSVRQYDLKQFFFDCQKRCRRLWLKLFYIRGYALYASEQEIVPIMRKFEVLLEKYHDYIDYEHILSVAGLPYLAQTYGYPCFYEALNTAKKEYVKIDPLLRGYFTLNEQLEQVNLLSVEEIRSRLKTFLEKHR